MSFLPDDEYALVERSVPIVCVDFVPVRNPHDGEPEVGLILRESPFGRVWCHLGGRIQRGETIHDTLQRHARETLNTSLLIGVDPQPLRVHQWFPPTMHQDLNIDHGIDPRKHAIGLSFLVELEGDPEPLNEALEFRFFRPGHLPEPMWPGSARLIELLGVHVS
ncbi:DUF4916 domain-containing protein [Microbacterium sp. C7(2022)]|uniref:DUF4916 domain-containing protein n=1 Tax=Microbacterium sp. C7(2022) TaxID=2992759 RepID=UPI00237B857B|nr:DUF4916 domain-containing protein [Microbacterium sp. C7(2022)]MDE0545387.1 NUDIX hydrolase [Microbacterium sp. C7(2022)]